MDGRCRYISIGGNRHPSAASWDCRTGLLAFGAGHNVALWQPRQECPNFNEKALLKGHSGSVLAVKFLDGPVSDGTFLLTGSADMTVRIWSIPGNLCKSSCVLVLQNHTGPIHCISATRMADDTWFIASAAGDKTIRIWNLCETNSVLECQEIQVLRPNPPFIPLCLATCAHTPWYSLILIVGGTTNNIEIFHSEARIGHVLFRHLTSLSGHRGWVRSLDLTHNNARNALLMASASQDKTIRLWRFHRASEEIIEPWENGDISPVYSFIDNVIPSPLLITFEALLLGHEDWVFTVQWDKYSLGKKILSASADNSVAIWEPQGADGVWTCTTRLGEMSSQKGSTTATGSAGGLWTGLWGNSGQSIMALGGTGSWSQWRLLDNMKQWVRQPGISGHTKAVQGIAWAKDGSYLLSTSLDQTTRLHSQWLSSCGWSWAELARPQIHGYDIQVIETIGDLLFVSGADEKILRVFEQPQVNADVLSTLSGTARKSKHPYYAADIPVLGLSNKATPKERSVMSAQNSVQDDEFHEAADKSLCADRASSLPSEQELGRLTLWPEVEKIFGHGFEISALAVSHDGDVLASACKATSAEHAVIRLFETRNWKELKPNLHSHSLTVNCLRFSSDDELLLSVGRDRRWSIFARQSEGDEAYKLLATNEKSHARAVLAAAWIHTSSGRAFVTSGRDKAVRFWASVEEGYRCENTVTMPTATTSIDFRAGSKPIMAMGGENGVVYLIELGLPSLFISKTTRLADQ